MKLKFSSLALVACFSATLATLPALAEEAMPIDGTISIDAGEAVDTELLEACVDTSTDAAVADEMAIGEAAGEMAIGEIDLGRSGRRCNCQNRCFSDTFCQLFAPGKVCRPVGACGCLKCVRP